MEASDAPFPFEYPGIISIPLSFLAIYLVSKLTKPDMMEETARAGQEPPRRNRPRQWQRPPNRLSNRSDKKAPPDASRIRRRLSFPVSLRSRREPSGSSGWPVYPATAKVDPAVEEAPQFPVEVDGLLQVHGRLEHPVLPRRHPDLVLEQENGADQFGQEAGPAPPGSVPACGSTGPHLRPWLVAREVLVHLGERELAGVDQVLVGHHSVGRGLRAAADVVQPHLGDLLAVVAHEGLRAGG